MSPEVSREEWEQKTFSMSGEELNPPELDSQTLEEAALGPVPMGTLANVAGKEKAEQVFADLRAYDRRQNLAIARFFGRTGLSD